MQMNTANNFRTPCQSRPPAGTGQSTANVAFSAAFATGNATATASATAGNATATARAGGNCDHVQLSNPKERGGNCPVNFGCWGEPSASPSSGAQQGSGTGTSGSSSDQTRDLLALALSLLLKNSQGQNQAQPQQGGDDQSKVGEAQKAGKKKDKKKAKQGQKS